MRLDQQTHTHPDEDLRYAYATPEHHSSLGNDQSTTSHAFENAIEDLGEDAKKLTKLASQRASLEVGQTLNELRIKIISGVAAAFAITYALFWTFSALAMWASPNVPLEYSLSGIALFHILLAGVLYYQAKKPLAENKEFADKIQKSQQEIKNSFHQLTVKTSEIKKIAVENLNPMIKVKRNPEVFLVGSFLLGVALSIFKPSTHGSSQNRNH